MNLEKIIAENMLRFGTKNISESDVRYRLTEVENPLKLPGLAEANKYFSDLVLQRALSTSDQYQTGTVLYKISGYNDTRNFYTVTMWGIVMKIHPTYETLPNPPRYFTAQGFGAGMFDGVNGSERNSPPASGGTLQFTTVNEYQDGGWNTTTNHWTKVIKTNDAQGGISTPALDFNVANKWIGIDNFKKMVNNLSDKSKLLTNFCTNYNEYIKVVPQDQRELYTCPTKKP
jgi:hypothetical protein